MVRWPPVKTLIKTLYGNSHTHTKHIERETIKQNAEVEQGGKSIVYRTSASCNQINQLQANIFRYLHFNCFGDAFVERSFRCCHAAAFPTKYLAK